jgi:hypothetical protein
VGDRVIVATELPIDEIRRAFIDCCHPEPKDNFIKRWLQKRRWLTRKVWKTDLFPVSTRSRRFPKHVFFYGPPESYVYMVHEQRHQREVILGVANYDLKTDIVWYAPRPLRHHNVLWIMGDYGVSSSDLAECKQGFMTNHGRFLTRSLALILAQRNGQLPRNADGTFKHVHARHLFSEDLW